ncbi:MAG: polysaccharide deacetylase [Micrococcaceae bacterium]
MSATDNEFIKRILRALTPDSENTFRTAKEAPKLPQFPQGTHVTPTQSGKRTRAETNVPMRKFKMGEEPPQFVLFSFDGGAYHKKWDEFRKKAKETNSRVAGFLSGVYLVTDDSSDKFTPPPPSPQGQSGIGFGGSKDDVKLAIEDLNNAYYEGHEIGTHYNAHMCGGIGNTWTTDQWVEELTEFFRWWDNWAQLDGMPSNAPRLEVPKSEVTGGRTPCLEGQVDQLFPALQKFKFQYDSSMPSPESGISWPIKLNGLWEFYMPFVQSDAFGQRITMMDYNFWYTFNDAVDDPSSQPELTQKVLATYHQVYKAVNAGNKAPIVIANHFNDWNNNSFNPAALQFMEDVCGKNNTICATYQDVIKWMEMQDPAYLKALQDRPAAG